MPAQRKKRNIALLVLGTGVIMFALMLIFVLPYFMSEKKYGEMQAALNEGDYYKVFKIAEFLLEQDESTIQAYYFRGQAYLALKKYEQAEQDLEKVIKLNAQYSNMRNVGVQLGEIYHKHGLAVLNYQPDKGYRIFLKALKFLPREINLKKDIAQASYMVGQAVEEKDKNKAHKFYNEAVNYDPEKALYKVSLARVLYNTGKTEEATALLTEAFEKDSSLKTSGNLNLLKNALWKLAIAGERDYFEGKLEDVASVTSTLDQIIEIESFAKDALLEKLSIAVNTNDFANAKKIFQEIDSKNITLPMDDVRYLINGKWDKQPQVIFTGNNETDVDLKLDSELAWSSDGNKIIVKAMDKTSSQAKILVYELSAGATSTLQSQDNISWDGKIFAPNADGIIVASDNNIYRVVDKRLDKLSQVDGKILDIARDGFSALIAEQDNLYRYDFNNNKRTSVALGKLSGEIISAAYSPGNKRIAVITGEDNQQKLGTLLGRSRSNILSDGNVTSLKWSWDGKSVYFVKKQKNISSVFKAAADAKTEAVAVTKPELNVSSMEPSPVDNLILFKGSSGKDILWLSDGGEKIAPVTPRYGQFGSYIWSPDGTKVLYLFSPVKGGPVQLELIDVQALKEDF